MKQVLHERFNRKLFLLCFLSVMHVFAFAQAFTVKGKITSVSGQPLQGAAVKEKGNNHTTVADNEGNFTINATSANAVLVVSSVGYETREIAIASQSSINITLIETNKVLDEVVVTAMGVKKETKKVGYSIQEIKGSDLNKVRDANPLNAMAGKVAGLQIGTNAEMLGRPEIVLRGSKDLLFVVDGVPVNSDTWNISPDDVESYSILKGPNAAALYGFRGINGAIVITTKRGTKNKRGWAVDFNSTNQFEKGFITNPEVQFEYGRGTNFKYSYGDVLYDNTQRLPEWGPRFEGQLIKQYDSPWDPVTKTRGTTPWLARGKNNFEDFVQTGFTTTNNISLSTAGTNYDMRISYSHMFQKGMFPNTKLNGDNLNINTGYSFNDKFKVEANLNLNIQYSPNIPDVNYGPNSYLYMFKVYGSSDYDVNDLKDIYKGPQGVPNLVQYAPEYGRENSAWFMAKEWLHSHNKTDIYGFIKLNYKATKDLNFSLRSQVTTWNQVREEKVPPSTNLNAYTSWYYFGWYGDFRQDSRNMIENNTDFSVNYDKKFNNWSLTALGGASMRSFKYESSWGTTKALAIPKLYSFSNSLNPALMYNWGSNMQVYSGYYSVDLGYKNYFTLNTTGRVDNLSTLPKGNNTFFYPSVSLSSVLSDYIKLPSVISFLKLRASVAEVKGGLTAPTIGSAFMAVTGNNTNAGLLGYGSELYSSYDGPTYNNQNSYSITSYYNGTPSVNYSNTIANPDLKPYKRLSYEAGMDIKFLKNRIGLDVTYFRTINGPQIYALNVAPSSSYTSHNVNGITTLNQGFEITLNAAVLKSSKGLNWNVSANWSTYKETLKEIYGDEKVLNINGHSYTVGERMDALYGTKFVRDDKGNIVHTSAGLLMFAPTGDAQNGFLGNLNPDFSFGITNSFSYKNFGLSFQFDGRVGGKIFDFTYSQTLNGGTAAETAQGAFGDARYQEWLSTNNGTVAATPHYVGNGVVIVSGTPIFSGGQITNYKDLVFAPNTNATTVQSYITGTTGLNAMTEYFMIDRTFAKLREVNLSYSLPERSLKGSFIKGVTFSLVGRNLLYFASRKDIDVDQYASGFNASDRVAGGSKGNVGLQSTTARRFGFNINLNF